MLSDAPALNVMVTFLFALKIDGAPATWVPYANPKPNNIQIKNAPAASAIPVPARTFTT